MHFLPLTAEMARSLELWFADPDTIRYLGGRDWLWCALDLMHTQPGTRFRDHEVLARYVWVVATDDGGFVGLMDVEVYDDATASFAFVVAPTLRGRGWGRRMLDALMERTELARVARFVGDVDPNNYASRQCLAHAGFSIAETVDQDGMLRVEKQR